MNAIQLLKSEHGTAKQMLSRIQSASGGERGQLWSQLKPELKLHEQVEEAALYEPAAREIGSSDEHLQEWQQTHQEEVAELESLVQELDRLDPSTGDWLDKLQELQQALADHIEEEEGDIWPRIEEAWDRPRLDRAGQEIEAMKRQRSRAA